MKLKPECENVKPCPFCGSKLITSIEYPNIRMIDGSQGEKIFCLSCGGASGIRTHKDAVKLWNERKVTE